MAIEIYRPNPHPRTWRKYKEKAFETVLKAGIIVLIPVLVALPAHFLWYYLIYREGWHYGATLTEYAVHYWLPTSGAFYILVIALTVNFSWDKMREIRKSVKCYDIVSFMHLRDEDVPPLMHCLGWFLALVEAGGLAGLPYPGPISGMFSTFGSIYMPALITTIVMQMDHPLYGIWHMKHIHPEWLQIEPRAWRDHYRAEHMKQACEGFAVVAEITETETETTRGKAA